MHFNGFTSAEFLGEAMKQPAGGGEQGQAGGEKEAGTVAAKGKGKAVAAEESDVGGGLAEADTAATEAGEWKTVSYKKGKPENDAKKSRGLGPS